MSLRSNLAYLKGNILMEMYFSPVNAVFFFFFFFSGTIPSLFHPCNVTKMIMFYKQSCDTTFLSLSLFFSSTKILITSLKSRFWETSEGPEKASWKQCLLTRNSNEPCLPVDSRVPAPSHPRFRWLRPTQVSSPAVQGTVRPPRTPRCLSGVGTSRWLKDKFMLEKLYHGLNPFSSNTS